MGEEYLRLCFQLGRQVGVNVVSMSRGLL